MNKDFKVDFFVVGAARSGTTSLYQYLNQHPSIFLPAVKECNFFSTVESKDPFTYKNPKPNQQYHMKIINSYDIYKSLFKSAKNNQLKGEISPSYLWDPNAAKRIYEHNKDAKIIITLRDPINRAFSHFLMHSNTGHEKESDFELALEKDKEPIWGGGNLYLEISKYFEQVKRYYDYFDPEQIKIIIYEDWIKDIQLSANEIYKFIKVNDFFNHNDLEKQNSTVKVKNKKLLSVLRSSFIKNALKVFIPPEFGDRVKSKYFITDGDPIAINKTTYSKLIPYFEDDIMQLEKITNISVKGKWNRLHD